MATLLLMNDLKTTEVFRGNRLEIGYLTHRTAQPVAGPNSAHRYRSREEYTDVLGL